MSNRRLRLGDHSTPAEVASALVRMAVVSANATVIDPCFGKGVFLRVARERLLELGSRRPEGQLYGLDINAKSLKYIRDLTRNGTSKQFLTLDFLRASPSNFGRKDFSVVVANPPFLRHHSIPGYIRSAAVSSVKNLGFDLPGRASYWAYFVAHAMGFVAQRGTLAVILPSSFLYAHYARGLREKIIDSFGEVTILLLRENVFPGVLERPAILLAKGRGGKAHQCSTSLLSKKELHDDHDRRLKTISIEHFVSGYGWFVGAAIGPELIDLLRDLGRTPSVTRLGNWGDLKIGVVTGANRFLIVSSSTAKRKRLLPRFLHPIITRATHLPGIEFAASDFSSLARMNRRVHLVQRRTNSKGKTDSELVAYLRWARIKGANRSQKARGRRPWYQIHDTQVPDAFLTYMSGTAPRLVLNSSGATCTNALHRVFWRQRIDMRVARTVAASTQTSLFGLSAELLGRSYGGGVLKLEPSDAADLLVPVDGSRIIRYLEFKKLNLLLRRGQQREAMEFADQVFLRNWLGLSNEVIRQLQDHLGNLRQLRLGGNAPEFLSSK